MPKKIKQDNQPLKLTFADEFADEGLQHWDGHGSDGLWATSFSPHLEDARALISNGEGQYYVDPNDTSLPDVFSIQDGALAITASELTDAQSELADGQDYISGLITTEMTLHTSSGYVEVRADIPDQQGFLSAFWLVPADGDWSSEIDVFEILGSSPERLNTNYWIEGVPDEGPIIMDDLSAGFHTYGMSWDADSITWYVDGVEVRTVQASITEPMQLAISLAVDTNWTGSPDDTTDFDDALLIDYVRVFETMSSSNPALRENGEFDNQVDDIIRLNDDTLVGTNFRDVMVGNATHETLYGKDGNDDLSAGRGDDRVFGGDGDDHLEGERGADMLVGGSGADVLNGGRGSDDIWGGSFGSDHSFDIFVFDKHAGADRIHDFDLAQDMIDLSSLRTSWEALQDSLSTVSWSAVIDLSALAGGDGDSVTLFGVHANALTEDHFVF